VDYCLFNSDGLLLESTHTHTRIHYADKLLKVTQNLEHKSSIATLAKSMTQVEKSQNSKGKLTIYQLRVVMKIWIEFKMGNIYVFVRIEMRGV